MIHHFRTRISVQLGPQCVEAVYGTHFHHNTMFRLRHVRRGTPPQAHV